MKTIIGIWIATMTALTGLGVWATYTDRVMNEASDYNVNMREDSAGGRRPYFFGGYFRGRAPTGGGLGFGK